MTGKSTPFKTCSGRPKPPICPYCSKPAEFFATSTRFYGGRDFGPVWACVDCNAWVGCHKGTQIALGRLADKELREWKIKAHAAFDALWKRKLEIRRVQRGPRYKQQYARGSGYNWLAAELGIARKDCHIGMFDVAICKRVVEVCQPHVDKITAKRRVA